MFDTNLIDVTRKVRCDDDCLQQGCPGHLVEIKICSVAGVGLYYRDGKHLLTLDRNHAEEMLSMLQEIKNS